MHDTAAAVSARIPQVASQTSHPGGGRHCLPTTRCAPTCNGRLRKQELRLPIAYVAGLAPSARRFAVLAFTAQQGLALHGSRAPPIRAGRSSHARTPASSSGHARSPAAFHWRWENSTTEKGVRPPATFQLDKDANAQFFDGNSAAHREAPSKGARSWHNRVACCLSAGQHNSLSWAIDIPIGQHDARCRSNAKCGSTGA